jgi:uncharacterized protein (TIGR02246 family)
MRNLLMFIVLFAATANADVVSEITQLLKEQDAAWNRGDLDGFLAPYDDTKNLVFVSTVVLRDVNDLKARYEKRYKTGAADFGKLTFSDLQVEGLAPGLARAWGRWSVDQSGKKSEGWFTLILQKQKGHWRIIHDHSS